MYLHQFLKGSPLVVLLKHSAIVSRDGFSFSCRFGYFYLCRHPLVSLCQKLLYIPPLMQVVPLLGRNAKLDPKVKALDRQQMVELCLQTIISTSKCL